MLRAIINKADEARAFSNINRLVSRIRGHAVIVAKNAGKEYVAIVRSGIGTTEPPGWAGPWKPLSKIWKQQKTAYKDKFWIETGGIYQSIRVDTLLNTLLMIQVFAGIRKGTDPDAFKRALKNEYGFGGGPWGFGGVRRPLFGPALDTFSQRIGGGQRKLIPGRIKSLFQNAAKRAVLEVYGRGHG